MLHNSFNLGCKYNRISSLPADWDVSRNALTTGSDERRLYTQTTVN